MYVRVSPCPFYARNEEEASADDYESILSLEGLGSIGRGLFRVGQSWPRAIKLNGCRDCERNYQMGYFSARANEPIELSLTSGSDQFDIDSHAL